MPSRRSRHSAVCGNDICELCFLRIFGVCEFCVESELSYGACIEGPGAFGHMAETTIPVAPTVTNNDINVAVFTRESFPYVLQPIPGGSQPHWCENPGLGSL